VFRMVCDQCCWIQARTTAPDASSPCALARCTDPEVQLLLPLTCCLPAYLLS
jgi:hypothetical protein